MLFLRKEQEEAERNKSIREAQVLLEKMELEKKQREEDEKKRIAEIEVTWSYSVYLLVMNTGLIFRKLAYIW